MDDDRRAQWLRGVLDLCILGALAEDERYGYDLAQRLAQAGLGRITGGTLYPLLARLEAAGLVASRWQPGAQGPGRKYYTLTTQGRHTLARQAAAWASFVAHVAPLVHVPPQEGSSDRPELQEGRGDGQGREKGRNDGHGDIP